MRTLFYNARKLDIDGEVDDFWMLVDGEAIVSTSIGIGAGADIGAHTEQPHADIRIDVHQRWLVPGFIDLHGHGGGGHSYDAGSEDIQAGLATHRAHGTTRSIISLVTQPISALRQSLTAIAKLAAADTLILGSHLEGPFLSSQRPGAHDPAHLRKPTQYEVEELIDAGRGTLRQVTLAPELPGAMEAIDSLVEADIAVAIGHTEADFDVANAAFDHGARLLTHVFNAMPGIQHRAPGPVIAAFQDERVTIELILDGLHVHPDVAHMTFRAAPGRIALVTDAMAAAGSSDGHYRLGSLNVTVHDGLAVLSGTQTLAGSTLTQDVALRVAIDRAGIAPVDAVAALTAVPATALGLGHRFGRLITGFAADAVLLDDAWRVQQVWANGIRLS